MPCEDNLPHNPREHLFIDELDKIQMMAHSFVCNLIKESLLLITTTKQMQKAFEPSRPSVLHFRFKVILSALRYPFDNVWPVLEYILK